MRSLFFVVALFVAGCGSATPQPAEPLDTDTTSAGPCLTAEQNLLTLQCKDSEGRLLGGPNKNNEPFHLVCQNSEKNHVDLNPVCLSKITDCAQVNTCPR